MNSIANLGVAEKITGQKWKWVTEGGDSHKNPAKKVDYNFAPKLDGDIITSQANLAATEKVLDHPYELLVQLNS